MVRVRNIEILSKNILITSHKNITDDEDMSKNILKRCSNSNIHVPRMIRDM